MSYLGLLNHTVRVYREADPEAARDSFGHVPALPFPIGPAPTARNARPAQNWTGTLADFGAGEIQGSAHMWHVQRDVDVRERDVLSVIGGPLLDLKLRVLSVEKASDSTRVHHLEVNVERFDGPLGDDGFEDES